MLFWINLLLLIAQIVAGADSDFECPQGTVGPYDGDMCYCPNGNGAHSPVDNSFCEVGNSQDGSITTTASPDEPQTTEQPSDEPQTTEQPSDEPETTENPETTVPESTTTVTESTEEPDTTAESTEEPDTTAESTEEPETTAESTEEPETTAESTKEPETTAESTEEPDTTEESTEVPDTTEESTEVPESTEEPEQPCTQELTCKDGSKVTCTEVDGECECGACPTTKEVKFSFKASITAEEFNSHKEAMTEEMADLLNTHKDYVTLALKDTAVSRRVLEEGVEIEVTVQAEDEAGATEIVNMVTSEEFATDLGDSLSGITQSEVTVESISEPKTENIKATESEEEKKSNTAVIVIVVLLVLALLAAAAFGYYKYNSEEGFFDHKGDVEMADNDSL